MLSPAAGNALSSWQNYGLVLSDFVITDARTDGVVTALHQATHATLHALAARLAHLGLTASEQNVLAVLADGRTRAVGELAAATGTRPTTLTSVLDRLEGRGHVVRELDPADRRSFLVVLTSSGRRTASAVHAAVADLERAALGSLSGADIAGFRAVTRALTEVHR
jgi:MarR family transcriptional regulator, organic hydroperoxide resistance regulator